MKRLILIFFLGINGYAFTGSNNLILEYNCENEVWYDYDQDEITSINNYLSAEFDTVDLYIEGDCENISDSILLIKACVLKLSPVYSIRKNLFKREIPDSLYNCCQVILSLGSYNAKGKRKRNDVRGIPKVPIITIYSAYGLKFKGIYRSKSAVICYGVNLKTIRRIKRHFVNAYIIYCSEDIKFVTLKFERKFSVGW